MPTLPHLVLADDLTGAAEVAAIAHQTGRRAVVLTNQSDGPVDADVLVFDTDTRLAGNNELARRIRSVARRLRKIPYAGVFLKVDSVLRGPVQAQLAACARAFGRARVLLVPANPSLGRIIRDGRYCVGGRPLHQTTFGRDPHHPRTTDRVRDLLGGPGPAIAVVRPRACRLPRMGVVVGEATTAANVAHWVGRLDDTFLPAGGADFFRAWLENQQGERRPVPRYPLPAGGVLLLHGTTAGSVNARALLFQERRPPSSAAVIAALERDGAVAVAASSATRHDPRAPAALSLGFARLAQNLYQGRAFHHLLVAGGATAAAVLRALGWSALKVVRVWDSGVVTLQPVADPGFAVTVKPGSYPWPANLRRALPDSLLS